MASDAINSARSGGLRCERVVSSIYGETGRRHRGQEMLCRFLVDCLHRPASAADFGPPKQHSRDILNELSLNAFVRFRMTSAVPGRSPEGAAINPPPPAGSPGRATEALAGKTPSGGILLRGATNHPLPH